ncbi:MAG: T9SS type A sorting domain-containing protein [Ignavibacteriae bacterium]|nr:T9SS type A sorting domain-containing protein [Ignavibacteriota bacterium]
MKKLILTLLLFASLFLTTANSTTFTVTASGFTFTPSSIPNANVGDTITWVLVSGIHTTTSVSIPSGAAIWDAPIAAATPTFSYVITKAGTYNYQCTFHALFGMTGTFVANPIGIQPTGEAVNAYKLSQNYPNPFNPSTVIKFSIPQSKLVTLKIYDVSGKEVETLVNSQLPQGTYNYTLNASGLSSGVYFYKITAGDFTEIKRMVLIK